ncbi:MAG: glutamate synthase subunit alpha, partial [Zetaproteobacteria bacterium]
MNHSATRIRRSAGEGLYDPRFEHDSCGVGFVAQIKNRQSHAIVEQGLEILLRLTHRGAVGADPREGDGAGILLQLSDNFFRPAAEEAGIRLPDHGEYGVAMCFLPRDDDHRRQCEAILEQTVREEGQRLLGWRDVPVDPDAADLPQSVLDCRPVIRQCFVAMGEGCGDQERFERKLFVIRKVTQHRVADRAFDDPARFYIASFSSRTIVYKGMFLSHQLSAFYP